MQENKLRLMELHCVELNQDLQLSNRRVKHLQESLAANCSRQTSLDSSDSQLDDEMYAIFVNLLGLLLNIPVILYSIFHHSCGVIGHSRFLWEFEHACFLLASKILTPPTKKIKIFQWKMRFLLEKITHFMKPQLHKSHIHWIENIGAANLIVKSNYR